VRHADGPKIVLHDEYARQLVQGGHVEGFVKLADIAGAISEEVDGHLVGGLVAEDAAAVGDLEGRAEADGDSFSNECISAQLFLFVFGRFHFGRGEEKEGRGWSVVV
jgi:hypothetical protein